MKTIGLNTPAFHPRSLVFACALLMATTLFAHDPGSGSYDGPFNAMSGEIIAPAAGRGNGATGSFWVTDLWLRGAVGSSVTLEFHAFDSTTAASSATSVLTMDEPVLYLPDVLRNQFGLEAGTGNIVIRGSQPVSGLIRTYARAGTGSYGSAFIAMPSSMAMGMHDDSGGMMGPHDEDDGHQLRVIGLLPQPQARVNLFVTNTTDAPISGTVDVLDADGGDPATGPLSFRFAIQPYSGHQFTDVLSGVTSRFAGGAGLQLRVRLDDGVGGMMMAIASVVDNETNDGYAVMGSMMFAGAPGGGPMMP